ncbi:MAG TPA: 7TM diverse intracellular signaling domain-containing protein, partial [Dongiaceae bacterium]|nr:7TM diverse intracellular signaling domain-containing protein [Dongiaceae bacterium]
MTKRILTSWGWKLAVCLLLAWCHTSQVFAVPAAIALDDNSDQLNLAHHLEYLVDESGRLTINDVQDAAHTGAWQPAPRTGDNVNFGYTNATYWFRFRLHNGSEQIIRKQLEIGYPVLDFIDVFQQFDDGNLLNLSMGDKRPFHDRPVNHRNFIVPVTLAAQDSVDIYLRVYTTSSMQLPLILWRDTTLLEASQAEMLGLGIYYGTMIVMILYNLFVFMSVREANYLYYVLYVACMALFLASLNGVSYQYLWPSGIWWNDQSIVFFLAGVVLFAALFTINFLRINEVFPRMQIPASGVVVVSAIVMLATLFLPYTLMIRVVIGWAVVGISLAITFGTYRWLSGDSSAKYYCIAWYAMLFGGVILALNKYDLVPRNFFTENGTQLGSALEVILLSFALADRL